MKTWLALLFGLSVSTSLAAADMAIEVIELKHTFADQVLPQVQPLLPFGASANAYDNKLIVKTTPANLEEIRQVVDALDRAPDRLLVTVRYSDSQDLSDSRTAVNGSFGYRGNRVEVHSRSYSTEDRSRGDQQVQVLAGQSAWINVGQDVPTLQIAPGFPPTAGIGYQSVGTGFSVTPRVVGDRVTVDVNPNRSRLASRGDGSIDTSAMSTTVSGRIGEWIELGGSAQSTTANSQTYTTHSRDYRDQTLLLKVERIP